MSETNATLPGSTPPTDPPTPGAPPGEGAPTGTAEPTEAAAAAAGGEEGEVGSHAPEVSEEVPEVAAPAATPAAPRKLRQEEEEEDEGERPVVHRHFIAPALIDLGRVDDDDTFRVRDAAELEDVAALATDLARLGQLFPIDVRLRPPDRFQIITGFRRVKALRFLQRDRVLARLHTDLGDDDALLMALASAIHSQAVSRAALEAVRERLAAQGALSPAARHMLAKALAAGDELGPEEHEEEVDADELAADVTMRLGQCNQDLSLLADVFGELEPTRRAELLEQLRYSAQLIEWLEGRK